MTDKPNITACFSKRIDQRLMSDFLEAMGCRAAAWQEEKAPRSDLYLLDAASARRIGRQVLAFKGVSEVFLPVLAALAASDDPGPWLAAGFDDALSLPVSKATLKNRIDLFIRLRRQSEALRRDQEQHYQRIFNATNSAIWVLDAESRIVQANKVTEAFFAQRPETLVGRHCWEVVHGTDRSVAESPILRARQSLKRESTDLQAGDRWLEVTVDPLMDDQGQFTGAVHIVSDITARKQAECKLEASENRLRTILDSAAEGIMWTDTRGIIQFVNPAFTQITGYTSREAVGRTPHILKSGQQDQDFYREMWETISAGRIWRGRLVNKHKDGTLYNCEMTVSPAMDTDGRILGFVAVKRDISGQIRLQEEKDRLHEQLNQAMKIEAIGRLAGGVAHDFNNMLSIIIGYAENLIQALHPKDPLREDAKEILEAGQRSAMLTRQLLAFSRRQTLQPQVMDINALLRGLENMMRRLIGEDIQLVLSVSKDLWAVKADPGQVEQIVMNLAVNARDAMPAGGKLTIETGNVELDGDYASHHAGVRPGRYVMLAISDTGCGMDKQTVSRVFEPFFTTKEKGKGTGLGLATVYGFVKQSGGNIWVYSEIGRGTTFKIYLPRTTEITEPKEPAEFKTTPAADGAHILVVEDEESLRNLCRAILSRQGFRVTLAANGGEALLLLEEKGLVPDLVITDVVMPNMSGKELIDRLRRSRPELKALYMSGYTDNAIVHHGILEAGIPFIQKPFGVQDLVTKIAALLKGDAVKP